MRMRGKLNLSENREIFVTFTFVFPSTFCDLTSKGISRAWPIVPKPIQRHGLALRCLGL